MLFWKKYTSRKQSHMLLLKQITFHIFSSFTYWYIKLCLFLFFFALLLTLWVVVMVAVVVVVGDDGLKKWVKGGDIYQRMCGCLDERRCCCCCCCRCCVASQVQVNRSSIHIRYAVALRLRTLGATELRD